MKLTSAQVERTLSQFEAQAVPDSHPMVPELNELFGDHTFFLDSNGLNIVEPSAEAPRAGAQAARVVNLCELEPCESHQPGASRARTDRRHHRTWGPNTDPGTFLTVGSPNRDTAAFSSDLASSASGLAMVSDDQRILGAA